MADTQVARRYAQAILNIAVDEDTLGRWRTDLADVAFLLVDSEAAPLLATNSIPIEKRYAVIEQALGHVQQNARNFAKLLLKKSRTVEAQAITDVFNNLADQIEGICHAEIITAVELNKTNLEAIEKKISDALNMKVETTSKIDDALVGGIVIKIGDHLIDGSLRTRLRTLRNELAGAR
ncbi:uncharacterized protein METZ01_LOCUS274602 [marine metagenome]|uniref:ATP synthase subunit delta n=1 Tax=marine metagenome TaxID=408172 RepID=A0A382KBK6_9ZZZZ